MEIGIQLQVCGTLQTTPIYFPDVDAGLYEAKRHGNCLFDDDLTLATQNGFLQTVNGTSTDESGNSLGSLAAAAATAYSFGAAGAATAAAKTATTARAAPLKIAGWEEVTNKAQFSSFQSLLVPTNLMQDGKYQSVEHHSVWLLSPMVGGAVTYARFDIALTSQLPLGDAKGPTLPPQISHKTNKYDGILVRDLIPYSLEITGYIWSSFWVTNDQAANITKYNGNFFNTTSTSGGGGGGQQASPFSQIWTYNLMSKYMTNVDSTEFRRYKAYFQTVMLPDTIHTRLLPISRRPLVTDSTKLTLVNGVVQSREDVRPSELFGWLSLPKTIVNAIVPFFGSSGNSGGGGSGGGGGNGGGNGGGGQGGGGQSGGGLSGQSQSGNGQGGGGNSSQSVSPPIQ